MRISDWSSDVCSSDLPMLAHKATHEGKLATEVAAGEKREWVARVIPSVAYTDPEIAWVGVTETEAKEKGLKVGVGKFPWAASGRAIGLGRTEGFTKLVFRSEEHTSELQSLMRISSDVFCLKNKNKKSSKIQ